MSSSYISDLSSQIITYLQDKDYESINNLLDGSLNNISDPSNLTTEEQNLLSDANTFKIFLQNKTTTKTFVEKYLYIIIKIIFFMVVIVLLFYSFFNDSSIKNGVNPFSNLFNFNYVKNLFNRENTVVEQKQPIIQQPPKVNKIPSSFTETIKPLSNNTLFPIKNSTTSEINTKN